MYSRKSGTALLDTLATSVSRPFILGFHSGRQQLARLEVDRNGGGCSTPQVPRPDRRKIRARVMAGHSQPYGHQRLPSTTCSALDFTISKAVEAKRGTRLRNQSSSLSSIHLRHWPHYILFIVLQKRIIHPLHVTSPSSIAQQPCLLRRMRRRRNLPRRR